MTNILPQTPAWRNDYPLTSEKVRKIINEQFPELNIESVQTIGEGWDNTTWKINADWLFRFPKHRESEDLIKNEITVSRLVSF